MTVRLNCRAGSDIDRRPIAALLISAVLLVVVAGCGQGETAGSSHGDGYSLYPKLPDVTGRIDRVEAQPANPRYFSILQITDGEGQSWQFSSDGWVGVSVGHLKDHQIQGTPVTVWYERGSDGGLWARFVGD